MKTSNGAQATHALTPPEYLNTNETPVYRKGRVLYNLHRARVDITRSGRASATGQP